jgi:hypothetical protein
MAKRNNGGGRTGCLVVALIVAVAALVGIIWLSIWLKDTANDPTSTGYEVLRVVRGELPAEQFLTEAIVDRMAVKAGVPPDERAALLREMGPISRDLPRLSEGEKEKLANLIRGAISDGHISDEELSTIRLYSYDSARDGNVKP